MIINKICFYYKINKLSIIILLLFDKINKTNKTNKHFKLNNNFKYKVYISFFNSLLEREINFLSSFIK